MKISKLFHWLYAILMLLPILVFIPNAFYYGFNEHAIAQEKTEQVPVYYESNEVNSNSDIVANHIYYWTDNFSVPSDITTYKLLMQLTYNSLDVSLNRWNIGPNIIYLTDNQNHNRTVGSLPMYFVPSNSIQYGNLPSDFYTHIEYTDFKVSTGVYEPLVTNMSITDSMAYAWNTTWQNNLFSWSYGSFLTQPFLYITNLFNVPPTNTLLYCLSYWLNISIIWLVFDVVLYVPLLVHRWIDKGIVE